MNSRSAHDSPSLMESDTSRFCLGSSVMTPLPPLCPAYNPPRFPMPRSGWFFREILVFLEALLLMTGIISLLASALLGMFLGMGKQVYEAATEFSLRV